MALAFNLFVAAGTFEPVGAAALIAGLFVAGAIVQDSERVVRFANALHLDRAGPAGSVDRVQYVRRDAMGRQYRQRGFHYSGRGVGRGVGLWFVYPLYRRLARKR